MKTILGAAAALSLAAGSADAALIVAPATVTVDVGGVAGLQFFAVDNIIDQSGLTQTYTAGVTEFEAFVAGDPTHAADLATRWLSTAQVGTSRLTFDFGRDVTLAKLALWDDRSTTISHIRMSTPDLGVFRELAVTDVLQTLSHAQVFEFAPVTTRYLSFEIRGCNAGGSQNWTGCGLNEVVFGEGVAGVPEPASWAIMILGLGATGVALRRLRASGEPRHPLAPSAAVPTA